jgi:hypothetical protein
MGHNIFVEDYWGMRIEFHVTLSDPVYTLKRMIEETDGKLIGVCTFLCEDPSLNYLYRFQHSKSLNTKAQNSKMMIVLRII